MRLFLYGTLLDLQRLSRFSGKVLSLVPATLPGWRRVAMRGGRYPTLVRARRRVAGALAAMDAATLRRLRAYEGPAYALRRLAVATARGKTVAGVWIAGAATTRPWP